MKKVTILFCLFVSFSFFGQSMVKDKPVYVIVINDEIVSKKDVEQYGKEGRIKSMNKGITEEKRDELFNKFGTKIGDKEFIITVSLFTKDELEARKKIERKDDSTKRINTTTNQFIQSIGDTAANFKVEMLDGSSIILSDLKGKVILLNFWATWCAPCIMEFYDIPNAILDPFQNKDFEFLPISIGEPKEKVIKKMNRLAKDGILFPVGIDPNKNIWDLYATGSIPKSVLIDRNGVIRYVTVGNPEGSLEKLAKEIELLLEE